MQAHRAVEAFHTPVDPLDRAFENDVGYITDLRMHDLELLG